MGKRIFTLIFVCLISLPIFAQLPDTLEFTPPNDMNLQSNLDSMMHLWYVDKYVDV